MDKILSAYHRSHYIMPICVQKCLRSSWTAARVAVVDCLLMNEGNWGVLSLILKVQHYSY